MEKWGIYRPLEKLAVRLMWQPDWPGGRPPGRPSNGQKIAVDSCRSTQTNKDQSAYSRSTARSTVYRNSRRARNRARPVDRPVDRPLGTVDRTCRPAQPGRQQNRSYWNTYLRSKTFEFGNKYIG